MIIEIPPPVRTIVLHLSSKYANLRAPMQETFRGMYDADGMPYNMRHNNVVEINLDTRLLLFFCGEDTPCPARDSNTAAARSV